MKHSKRHKLFIYFFLFAIVYLTNGPLSSLDSQIKSENSIGSEFTGELDSDFDFDKLELSPYILSEFKYTFYLSYQSITYHLVSVDFCIICTPYYIRGPPSFAAV